MFGRLTPMVKGILIINIGVFIIVNIFSYALAFLSLFPFKSDLFKPFQLFTYMFTHQSFGHIFFNMIGLVVFGSFLEQYWGQNRFLTFYLVTGIGAAVFFGGINYFELFGPVYLNVPMIGASGAVYGLLMGCAMLFPNTQVYLLFPPIPIKLKWLALVLGGISIFSTINNDPSDNVAHLAHLGGMVFAFIMIKIWQRQDHRY